MAVSRVVVRHPIGIPGMSAQRARRRTDAAATAETMLLRIVFSPQSREEAQLLAFAGSGMARYRLIAAPGRKGGQDAVSQTSRIGLIFFRSMSELLSIERL
jgi:hypothetical protein